MQSYSDAIQWGILILKKRKAILLTEPEIILKTPYSSVTKFTTAQGSFYLKETPPDLFVEAGVIQILKNKINAIVPTILEINKDFHCFLMLDGGISLQEYLKNNFQSSLVVKSIKEYTRIQSESANYINDFLKLSVPDWRLKELPVLYHEIIRNEKSLQKDGLTNTEFKNLQDLYPTFLTLCNVLSKFKISETIDHCDFHVNNILINPKNYKLTLIDLGEVVITHPFFSLLSFISKQAAYHSCNDRHPIFIELLNACFENWAPFLNKDDFKKAMLIAKKLWPIYSALGYYRLISSSGMDMTEADLISYYDSGRNKGRFATYFKDFISDNLNTDPTDTSQVKLSYPGSRFSTKV